MSVLLSTWVLVGLLLDAWAHNNVPQLESFFTPWHGVLYSGFVANAAWICAIVWRHVRAGRRGLAAVPVGYGLAIVGLPLFLLAGVGDLTWHTVFGIERDLKILFSPTHLVLVASMILVATSPLRSMWASPDPPAPTLRRLLPAVLSLALVATGVLVFLQYANAFLWSPQRIVDALSTGGGDGFGGDPVGLVTAVAITNVVMVVPLLLLGRRWPIPPGAMAVVCAMIVGLCGAITEFSYPDILLALLAAGVCVDVMVAWLRPGPARRHAFLAFSALAPLILWCLYVAVAAVAARHAPTVVEYWTGVPVVAALHGLLLGVLAGSPGPPVAAGGADQP